MRLSKKVRLYTTFMAGIISVLILSYFIIMLPGLYTDYHNKNNLQSIKTLQQHYRKKQDVVYEDSIGVSYIAFVIPDIGYDIRVTYNFGYMDFSINERGLQEQINKVREFIFSEEDLDEEAFEQLSEEINFDSLKEELNQFNEGLENIIEITDSAFFRPYLSEESDYAIHAGSVDDSFIIESRTISAQGDFTYYAGLVIVEDSIYVTFAVANTPELSELQPIVFQSLPMIILVIIGLILIIGYVFSKNLAIPIEKISKQARLIQMGKESHIEITGDDEFATLGNALNQLYDSLKTLLDKQQSQNLLLKEQQERQQLFIAGSSHQLKTPIAAASLLVDGMISEIGKYQDTQKYLPQVKAELLGMRNIINDMLLVTQNSQSKLEKEEIQLHELIDTIISQHKVGIFEKEIIVNIIPFSAIACTDGRLLFQILDNIISNAIKYSNKNGEIIIKFDRGSIYITNLGVEIEKELLPHIFEPFVRSMNTAEKGHGLGLYLASYYAELLEYQITIRNKKFQTRSRVTQYENIGGENKNNCVGVEVCIKIC